jgi:uncharacterized phage protein (TIGR02218 family)
VEIPLTEFMFNGPEIGGGAIIPPPPPVMPGAVYVGKVHRFQGTITEIQEGGRTQIPVVVKSDLFLLNVKLPRNVYQPTCRRVLYAAGCEVSKMTYGANSTTLAGSTQSTILTTLSQAIGWFSLGTITFTTGLNAGISRTVKSYSAGVFTFALPLPYPPGVGDSLTAYAGCDRMQSTCQAKFNNLLNFSAEPYIPAAETAY